MMFERLVVAYDGSGQAKAAVDLAFELADRRGANVTVAHVIELPEPVPELPQVTLGIQRLIELAEEDWRGRLAALAGDAPEGTSVDTEVLLANKPAPALLELLGARRADVLDHGRAPGGPA